MLVVDMAVWTDSKKFMWYGWSGYDYHVTFTTVQSLEAAMKAVTQFFLSRCASKTEVSDGGHLRFARGKRPWCWLSILETRQPQSIDVRIGRDLDTTTVSVDYHVMNRFGLIVAPCMFTREVTDLRAQMDRL